MPCKRNEPGAKKKEKMNIYNLINENGKAMVDQIVIANGQNLILQSYKTKVAQNLDGKIFLDPKWNCSKTTTKAVTTFLKIDRKAIEAGIKSGLFQITNLNLS